MVQVSLTKHEVDLLMDAIDDFIKDEERFRKHAGGPSGSLPPKNQRRIKEINKIRTKLQKA